MKLYAGTLLNPTRIRASTLIHRPQADVWSLMTDPETWRALLPPNARIELLSPDSQQVGSRWNTVNGAGDRAVVVLNEVIESSPPHRQVVKSTWDKATNTVRTTLEAADDGTVVLVETEIHWQPGRRTIVDRIGAALTANQFSQRAVEQLRQKEMDRRRKSLGRHDRVESAGFCWPRSNPNTDGTLVPDEKVGTWQMPWNAKPDAGRLAAGIAPSNFWAFDINGIDQVGYVYTAQGFEFDYGGVIWGRDLRWDPATNDWIGDRSHSHDSIVKRSGDRFTDLVKRTYRVLLTRGLKASYVYFDDIRTGELIGDAVARRSVD
jgi:uncharacterized protein YndB with AHSA1/START domain